MPKQFPSTWHFGKPAGHQPSHNALLQCQLTSGGDLGLILRQFSAVGPSPWAVTAVAAAYN